MKNIVLAFVCLSLMLSVNAGSGGDVSFNTDFTRYQERDGKGLISITRSGENLSGDVTVKVKMLSSVGEMTQYGWEDQSVSWSDGIGGSQEVSFDLYDTPRKTEGTVYFELGLELESGEDVEVSTNRHMVCISDSTRLCFERPVYELSIYRDVPAMLEIPVIRIPGGVLSERMAGGSLPPGFSVSYSPAKKALLISGILTSSTTNAYSFKMRPIATIAGCGLLQTFIGEVSDFTITVKDLSGDTPKLNMSRNYPLVPLYWEGSFLAGTLSVSITPMQQITAKYVGGKGKLTFVGTWSRYDAENGVLFSYLEKKKNALFLEVETNGLLRASMYPTANMSDFGDAENAISGSALYETNVDHSPFVGIYTVQMPMASGDEADDAEAVELEEKTDKPTGDASLVLTMDSAGAKNGKIKYVGIMPDGTKLSGSTVLFSDAQGNTLVAIYQKVAKESFGAVLELSPGNSAAWRYPTNPAKQKLVMVAKGTEPYYLHSESGYYRLQGHEAYGGAWRKNAKIDEVCDLFGTGRRFNFVIRTDMAKATERLGSFAECPTNKVEIIGANRISVGSSPLKSLKIKYKSLNGVVSGSATIVSDERVKTSGRFQGVIMPEGGQRPFASGTFWFKDKINGLSRNRSLPFEMWPTEETD